MSSSVLEIVELPDGQIVLKRADGKGEALVRIQFSEESGALIQAIRLDVAKAMIQAGIQAFAELSEQVMVDESIAEYAPGDHVVH